MSFCVAKTNECLRACEQVLASVSELTGDSLLPRRPGKKRRKGSMPKRKRFEYDLNHKNT